MLAAARDAGHVAVHGRYRPTAKNAKVRDLYPHYGFAEARQADGATVHVHDLAEIAEVPAHLTLEAEGDLVPRPLTS